MLLPMINLMRERSGLQTGHCTHVEECVIVNILIDGAIKKFMTRM